jgi:hypothetical protein
MRIRHARRGLSLSAVAAGIVLASAACGDDEPSVDPEADEAAVEAAVLTPEDLPDGFVEAPPGDGDESTSLDACFEEAAGVDREELEAARTARSEAVQLNNQAAQLSLRPRISAFESDDVPEQIIDAFGGEDFLACMRESVGKEMAAADLELTSIEPLEPAFGPSDAVAYDLRVLLDAGGTAVETRAMALLVGRYVVALEASGLAGQLDEAVLGDAIETMAGRVDAG